ncbi:MAG: WG repeat-containing protein, partial [Cytophagales bacterium]|nr:WG repeat-containing protein [Cytophagales bacterium]
TALLKVQENGRWGVLDKAARVVVPVQYDEVRVQTYGMFTARQGNGWQLLDAQGQPVGANTFEAVDDFQFLHAVARAGGKTGLVNLKCGWTMEPRFDSLRIISDFLVLHQSEGIKAISNLHTQQLILEVDSVEPVHNYFRVIVKGKQGLYNARGQEVLPVVYDYVSDFSQDSIITVVQGKKKGLMGINGRPILAPDALYQELLVMTDQRVGVKIKNKYGFVDDRGRLRIANRYEGVSTFSEGYAAVKIRGGWGFIDKDENLRVQPFYTATMPFRGGVARVKRTLWGFVDKSGKETTRPAYDSVQVLPTGRYLVWKDGRRGLVSEKGRELFAPRYDFVSDHANGFVLLGRNGKLGLSDTGGFDVLPVIYDRLYFNAAKNFYITGMEPKAEKYTFVP